MKYKVGDKVRVITSSSWMSKGKIVEIIEVDKDDLNLPYRCKGKRVELWMPEDDIEPVTQPLTFQQKLDRFKSERVGFLVKSKEIANELTKVFEREGLLGRGDNLLNTRQQERGIPMETVPM